MINNVEKFIQVHAALSICTHEAVQQRFFIAMGETDGRDGADPSAYGDTYCVFENKPNGTIKCIEAFGSYKSALVCLVEWVIAEAQNRIG